MTVPPWTVIRQHDVESPLAIWTVTDRCYITLDVCSELPPCREWSRSGEPRLPALFALGTWPDQLKLWCPAWSSVCSTQSVCPWMSWIVPGPGLLGPCLGLPIRFSDLVSTESGGRRSLTCPWGVGERLINIAKVKAVSILQGKMLHRFFYCCVIDFCLEAAALGSHWWSPWEGGLNHHCVSGTQISLFINTPRVTLSVLLRAGKPQAFLNLGGIGCLNKSLSSLHSFSLF